MDVCPSFSPFHINEKTKIHCTARSAEEEKYIYISKEKSPVSHLYRFTVDIKHSLNFRRQKNEKQ
jgi:hypothetical protein